LLEQKYLIDLLNYIAELSGRPKEIGIAGIINSSGLYFGIIVLYFRMR
jgi:hypothetical protein